MIETFVFNIYDNRKYRKLTYPEKCIQVEKWMKEKGILRLADETIAKNKNKLIYQVEIPDSLDIKQIYDELFKLYEVLPFINSTDHHK